MAALAPQGIAPCAPAPYRARISPLEGLPVELMEKICGQPQVTQREVLALRRVSRSCRTLVDAAAIPTLLPRAGTKVEKPKGPQTTASFLQTAKFATDRLKKRDYASVHFSLGGQGSFFRVDAHTCLVLCGNGRLVQGSLSATSALFEEVASAGTFLPTAHIVDAIRSPQADETYRLLIFSHALRFVACAQGGVSRSYRFPVHHSGAHNRSAAFDHTGMFAAVGAYTTHKRFYLGGGAKSLCNGRPELVSNRLKLAFREKGARSAATGSIVRLVVPAAETAKATQPWRLQCSALEDAGLRSDRTLDLPWQPRSVQFSPDGQRLSLAGACNREDGAYEIATVAFRPSPKDVVQVEKIGFAAFYDHLSEARGALQAGREWVHSNEHGWQYQADWRPKFFGRGPWRWISIPAPGIQWGKRWSGLYLEPRGLTFQTVLHNGARQPAPAHDGSAVLVGLSAALLKYPLERAQFIFEASLGPFLIALSLGCALLPERMEAAAEAAGFLSIGVFAAALVLRLAQIATVQLVRREREEIDASSAPQRQDLCTLPLPRLA